MQLLPAPAITGTRKVLIFKSDEFKFEILTVLADDDIEAQAGKERQQSSDGQEASRDQGGETRHQANLKELDQHWDKKDQGNA